MSISEFSSHSLPITHATGGLSTVASYTALGQTRNTHAYCSTWVPLDSHVVVSHTVAVTPESNNITPTEIIALILALLCMVRRYHNIYNWKSSSIVQKFPQTKADSFNYTDK